MDNRIVIEMIVNNVEKVIMGKRNVIEKVLMGMLANGHILIEDTPGVGKTMLVRAVSKSFGLDFKRVQFTPDLMPSDITGISIYNQKDQEFRFKKGPIFTNLLLGDEINRTSPKTQSALLEAMEEKQISEGNDTYFLDNPFLVIATQNSIDNEGTYPLPEAQLDRFIMKIRMGYPSLEDEIKVLQTYKERNPLAEIEVVCEKNVLQDMQRESQEVVIKEELQRYIVELVNETRKHKGVLMGVSTRGAINLMKIACASAYIDGRNYVIADDIKKNFYDVMEHRMRLSPWAKAEGKDGRIILKEILDKIKVPRLI